jgi:hypothetical protein
MDLPELQDIVDAITENRRIGQLRPHELLASIHRKKFSAVDPVHREQWYEGSIQSFRGDGIAHGW